jgi:hypothetical protein
MPREIYHISLFEYCNYYQEHGSQLKVEQVERDSAPRCPDLS